MEYKGSFLMIILGDHLPKKEARKLQKWWNQQPTKYAGNVELKLCDGCRKGHPLYNVTSNI